MNDINQISNLKGADKARAGRKGGPAAAIARAKYRADFAELEQALATTATTPGTRALAKATLAGYTLVLRMQNPAGRRQPDIRGVSALLSGFTANLERLGMLPESTTAPPSFAEPRSLSDAPADTPTRWERPADCTCPPNAKVYCAACTESLTAWEAARRAAR